jgi:dinuclear metal center YbgI/SA1388 family protein
MNNDAIINFLETVAPLSLQEEYDNSGLISGDIHGECQGVMVTLDINEKVIAEAIEKGCNLIVAHHPLIFGGIRSVIEGDLTGRLLMQAIRAGISIYAIHTNLDNVLHGVNGRVADLLGLQHIKVLKPAGKVLRKLHCFVPIDHASAVKEAIFQAGAGHIGKYSECSFTVEGEGTFLPLPGSNPFKGDLGHRHVEKEIRLEIIFPFWLEGVVVKAMRDAHPYEEVAYDLVILENSYDRVGSGIIGELPDEVSEKEFLERLQKVFGIPVVRYSPLRGLSVRKVAVCGGAGSFLISNAIGAGADIFVTSDLKYHDFFKADDRIILADIGHYESEQYTSNLLCDLLKEKFPNFAVLKSNVQTNPVNYLI